MVKKSVSKCFVVALLFLCFKVYAQRDISFSSLTTKYGLSSNSTNAVLKDHYGLMWFGTEEGLNRYDGLNFKVFRHNPNHSNSLQSNEITALYEDRAGKLWIGTSESLHLYNRNKNTFYHFKADGSSNALSGGVIRAICSDYSGRIWVGNLDGLDIIDPITLKITKMSLSSSTNKPVQPNGVLSLYEDGKKRMWVGTKLGLFLYDRKHNKFLQFQHQLSDVTSLIGNVVKAIGEDQHHHLWIGTTSGLSRLMPDEQHFYNLEKFRNDRVYSIAAEGSEHLWIGTENGLSIININTDHITKYLPDDRNPLSLTSKSIRNIMVDKTGIVWLGTYEGGVDKYDKNLTLFNLERSDSHAPDGLSAPFVTSFAEDKKGNLFVGTDGGGLNQYHRKTNTFTRYRIPAKNNLPDFGLSILTLAVDKDDKLWIGTYRDGLFQFDLQTKSFQRYEQGINARHLNNNDVFCLKVDHYGKIWVGTNGGGVNVFDQSKKTFVKYAPNSIGALCLPISGNIRAIEEDQKGNIWIGSYGGGLAILNPARQKFRVLNKRNGSLPSDKITNIFQDRQGRIWVGTGESGLILLNPDYRGYRSFTEVQGLANGYIRKIIQDRSGRIWLSTNKGISYLDPVKKHFINYTKDNGLQTSAFANGAGLQTSDGTLFFGGAEGFNFIKPEDIKINRNIPAILFTNLKVNNRTVTVADSNIINSDISLARQINIKYKQNFSISWGALDYTLSKENHYIYRLKGFEQEWNDAGTSTTAGYTNLNPGHYVFEVKASNNDGIWSKHTASILITVKPPFWMTIYAYILYVLFGVAALLYIRYRGIKKLQQQFKFEQEKREAERLHELDRLKIKFLTNLSHEFRTPLSLIMAPADKLMDLHTDDITISQVQIIKRNAKRLLNLVNQLLDFRKMEEKELKLNLAPGDLVPFLKEAADSFCDVSVLKGVNFKVISTIDTLIADFDHDKIERIVFNLLSNAFKFTQQGGTITFGLSMDKGTDQEHPVLQLIVTDTGIGIADEQQSRIFERFSQSNQEGVYNQGSGIGLSITKEFVQLHGGEIYVSSSLGEGTTFTILLPVKLKSNYSLLPAAQINTEKNHLIAEDNSETLEKDKTGKFLILLVEDNDDMRFYLKDNLRTFYQVIEAVNGKEGWQKALSAHPHLVVSDISMPYMNGIELSRKIKSDKRTKHIPVILLTAITGEQEQLVGLGAGANDYLTKPFNFEILNAKIKNLLLLNQTFKKTYQKQIQIFSPELEIESADTKLLAKINQYVEEKLTDPELSVEELSKYVGMSRSALYLKLLELTGNTPVEYIRTIKLNKAAILLEKSDYKVAQISYMTGFATPGYFSRMFKAQFNLLPSDYRNKIRSTVDVS